MRVLCCSSQSDLEANLFKVCHLYYLTGSLHFRVPFFLMIFAFLILFEAFYVHGNLNYISL